MSTSADAQTCRSVGILSMGLDEPRAATSLQGKGDMRHKVYLVGAGHSLVLRF